jgi:hypothetical protein
MAPDDELTYDEVAELTQRWGLTPEEWPQEFPHFTAQQFLSWLHDQRLPDRCTEAATLARLAAITA